MILHRAVVRVPGEGDDPDQLKLRRVFQAAHRGEEFDVVLQKVSGAAFPVSYLCDVKTLDGVVTLATAVAPRHRPLTGQVPVPATRGTGVYVTGGPGLAFVPTRAEETFGETTCNTLDDYYGYGGSA